MASCRGCFFLSGVAEVVTGVLCSPHSRLWICSQCYHGQRLFLILTVSDSTNHCLTHGFWWQHRTQTSTWYPMATQTVGIIMSLSWGIDLMVFTNNTDQGHQHGFRLHHRPQTSTLSLAAAQSRTSSWPGVLVQTVGIHMAFGDKMGHGHQYGPWMKHDHRHQHHTDHIHQHGI